MRAPLIAIGLTGMLAASALAAPPGSTQAGSALGNEPAPATSTGCKKSNAPYYYPVGTYGAAASGSAQPTCDDKPAGCPLKDGTWAVGSQYCDGGHIVQVCGNAGKWTPLANGTHACTNVGDFIPGTAVRIPH